MEGGGGGEVGDGVGREFSITKVTPQRSPVAGFAVDQRTRGNSMAMSKDFKVPYTFHEMNS